jgi:2-succinyl-5-enolpyruvyl-6-hydroxy-3-cyclohexene-1-carboxylate synthase
MNLPIPADVQAAYCAVLVDEWARGGVTEAVVAPGSRSTPLVVALDADPRLRVHVVLDERSAGFVALGIGLATGRPAVVVTTSGTAAVELHPAMVESSHAGVPLIAATADRPPELHAVGAPQTVEQAGLYGAAVRWAVSPGVADLSASDSWRSLAARVVAAAGTTGRVGAGETGGPGGPGPVHLNLAFREPLLGSAAGVAVPAGRPGDAPWHERFGEAAVPASWPVLNQLAAHAGGRGLVVAGAGAGDPATVIAAARRLGWPLFADPRSGCRVPGEPVIAAADALLRMPEVSDWHPDVVLRLGAPWASKVLGQWLAGLGPEVAQVLVDPWGRWADPDRRVGRVVAADPTSVVSALLGAAAGDGRASSSDWFRQWAEAERTAQAVLGCELSESAPLAMSEPAVARTAMDGLPDGALLVASSSMPIRDVEWYSAPRPNVTVLANRGANGIDGVVSTAVGVALGRGEPTVALLGDLAFLYDAGGLLGARSRDMALTVVVVDNDGGGIFSFLPQASALPAGQFERYWGTPHGVDVGAVAAAYGAEVWPVETRADLDALMAGSSRPGTRVGVVRSDRTANVSAHDHLHDAVAAAVRRRLLGDAGADPTRPTR